MSTMPSGELTITVVCPCCAEELDVKLIGSLAVSCHQQNYPPVPDTTPPNFVSGIVGPSATKVYLTFSEKVYGTGAGIIIFADGEYSWLGGGTSSNINTITGQGTTVLELTMQTPLPSSPTTVSLIYIDGPGGYQETGDIVDGAGNALAPVAETQLANLVP